MSRSTDHFELSTPLVDEPPKAPPCVFVLFGATGDLSARKIAPALYNLARDGLLGENVPVLGVARRPRSDEQFRNEMLDALRKHSRTPVDEQFWAKLSQRWYYHRTHADDAEGYASLRDRLAELDDAHGAGGNRVYYLAMTPETFGDIARGLGEAGLSAPAAKGGFARLIVEKPFGWDLQTARELNAAIREHFDEEQICRIDHYLGKEAVQNLLVLRFANAVFEPFLNRRFVDHVQMTTAEASGMEGRRGAYYEKIGALRDMVQNHMFQLLSLLTMEAPHCLRCEAVRDRKLDALQSIEPLTGEDVIRRTVRAQYTAGNDMCGYREEQGVAADSEVETYAALKLYMRTPRWEGVPFYLRTGKRLAEKTSHVVIVLKREAEKVFDGLGCDVRGPNRLNIRIFPDEGVSLVFDAKVPGPRMLLRPVKMNFSYGSSFESASPEAYEQLLLDALAGDRTLFISDGEVEASWRIIDSIREVWTARDAPPLRFYPAGSGGPDEARKLFEDPYKRWYEV
ncbi:MAG: glucose-6-phosphate dehydrogenase [Planctomycetota bacterium]